MTTVVSAATVMKASVRASGVTLIATGIGVVEIEPEQEAAALPGERHAEQTAEHREDETLGEELTNDAQAARANGQTHGDLALSCSRPRQQQT